MSAYLTNIPIDRLKDNGVEMLKVSLIERYLDNRIYKSNTGNVDFDDLPFDGDNMLIAR